MPNSMLYAINTEGRVYALSTGSSAWREFQYLGLEFKKVSAIPHFMWAIGGDRQVYVHVHGLDIPIRVKEESYENERWLPFEGWGNKLLPTDRYNFSSEDGTIDRNIEKIRLPSMAWQWEGDWHLDCTLDGQPLDHSGWTYALDFPANYHVEPAWKTYVRRRKWIRFRRYSALNSWCAVAPLHKDPTQEPFIDVAIGGTNIPSASPGTLLVWAITAHGRVMFRTGVTTTSPEGLRWTAVSTPSGSEVSQISVGATGLVWAVLFNGRAIVRSGITRDTLTGQTWLEVKSPGNGLKINHVSVGTNSVWCVTNNNHVWFRRGIKGEASGISEDAAIGSGWVEMVGNISIISVSANDQVFGIGSEDRALYYRSGVSSSDLTGKKWRLIHCPMQLSRTSSTISLMSRKSGSSSPGSKHRSFSSLFKEKAHVETSAIIETVEETSRSAPNTNQKKNIEFWQNSTNTPPNIGSLTENRRHTILIEEQGASSAPAADIKIISGRIYETQLKNPRAWSPVRSVGSIVGTEAHPESDSCVFDADTTRDSGIFAEDDDPGGSQYWTECDIMWSSCSANAVNIDPNQLPNWFNDNYTLSNEIELNKKWRLDILEKLQEREKHLENLDLEKYEKAVELTSWTKTSEAKLQKSGGQFEDCIIELEWVNSLDMGLDSGTLTILNSDAVTTKVQFSLSEITCVQCCSEPGFPRILIHAPRLMHNSSLIKLQFSGDNEMEDWLSHLTSVCCQINQVRGKPSIDSVWMTTNLGEVFNFDPSNFKSQQWNPNKNFYSQMIDLSATETPYYNILYNGMTPGTELEISGCVYDDADQIRFDLQCHPNIKVSHKVEKLRIIAMHINPRFNEKAVILNTMQDSEWLEEIRNEKIVFTPGAEFKLVIKSTPKEYEIIVDDVPYCKFKHVTDPEAVTSLYVSGRVKLFSIIYNSPSVIVSLRDIFWRQMGGHLKKVKTCKAGITWGISNDNTAWVYTGGWGGSFLKGVESNSGKVNQMTDIQNYYIYENQRWNPLSGYTTTGLPTDRHTWSDITGKHKRSKEYTKLLSMHWQWISDWLVDFHVPGGVDRDGWQYAVDFPATYHGNKQFTDYVRRRRWYRKCKLTTSGPWQELGNSKILDVVLQPIDNIIDGIISVWAIAVNGDVLLRRDVSQSTPGGHSWEHVTSEEPLVSISCGLSGEIWAISKTGYAFYRFGITKDKPEGEGWQKIENPRGVSLKQISGGKLGIWAIDSTGRLLVRKEINQTFPEGSYWQILPNIPNHPPHTDGAIGFKSISVSNEVWAISNSCFVCKRCGITKENPGGTGWNLGIPGIWQQISHGG